jgi:hypothetical protein
MDDFCRFAINFYSSDESKTKPYENIYENMVNFLMISFCQIKREHIHELYKMDCWNHFIRKLVNDLCQEDLFIVASILRIILCISNFPDKNSAECIFATPILSIFSTMIKQSHKHRAQIFRIINNFAVSGDHYIDAILIESTLIEQILHTINFTSYSIAILEEALHTLRSLLQQTDHRGLISYVVQHLDMWDIIYTKIDPRVSVECLLHIHDILESLYIIGKTYSEISNEEDNLLVQRVIERDELKDLLELSQGHPECLVYEKYFDLINEYFVNSTYN